MSDIGGGGKKEKSNYVWKEGEGGSKIAIRVTYYLHGPFTASSSKFL